MIRSHWHIELETGTRVELAHIQPVEPFEAYSAVRYPSGRTYGIPTEHVPLYFRRDEHAPDIDKKDWIYRGLTFADYLDTHRDGIPAVLLALQVWEPYELQCIVLSHGDTLVMPHAAAGLRFAIKTPQEVVIRQAFGNIDERPTEAQAGLLGVAVESV